ncbi:putative 8-amino-7-oxononanoate synthase [Paenibacillus baekrokdamisoli]|uniref:8-amino-7-ketopelargonate synthase n=1 Tax=Paenibacillus baekrokdamisoli TaxID=1712516 RepID=A0A3G9J2V9_9BACL|nr:8-amino-7-oxononanoate synthase [Paenibacillus baekrokdamisoli]MBB3067775.1 8-amino-7-oxononanoate synthase [Paenibacillus baekrokdamisoli]BBH19043.1 putative 8-amino-7-oxononanoate synthase [Paenibacillus baekrokdamisoli]
MNWMEKELELLAEDSLERFLRDSAPVPECPGYTVRGERLLLNLASNDYLGLAQHPAIIETMREMLLTEGGGSGASRLVTGNRPPYGRLEEALATWQNSEAALVFANGYMANSGVIRALMGRGDVVFSDQFNHASIVDGIVLSRAEHARYRHNDKDHLKLLMNKHRDKRRKLIVTDAIFSMDGDQARLRELVELKCEYGAMLMVDEAHSGGIYGERGEGLCYELGLHNEVDIHMGTFSKSFGVYGAYVCGSRNLIRWLINKARPLIYSTALPPSLVAGVSTALDLVKVDYWRRERLFSASRLFRSSLCEAGFNVINGDSPIVPVIIGENEKTLRFSHALEGEGIAAVAIRPPTVPEGTARIRFSLSAAHTDKELIDAAALIRKIGLQLGVLSA